jgi:hypothetical protein
LMTCGKNVMDEMHPAVMPSMSVSVMVKIKGVKIGKKVHGFTGSRVREKSFKRRKG